MGWLGFVYLILSALLVWFAVSLIKRNPESFSKENMGKSLQTVGMIALILIAVVTFCVLMLKG